MPTVERPDAICGGWDFLPFAARNLQPRSRIGGSAWIELELVEIFNRIRCKDTVKGY